MAVKKMKKRAVSRWLPDGALVRHRRGSGTVTNVILRDTQEREVSVSAAVHLDSH
jgi:hypothetical protein